MRSPRRNAPPVMHFFSGVNGDSGTTKMSTSRQVLWRFLSFYLLILVVLGLFLQDFSSSWRDGLGFCALVHSQNESCLLYDAIDPKNHLGNLNLAFETAEKEYGITKLLDAEDIDVQRPDEKSVLTYIASYYHTFSKLNQGHKGAKRINNIISKVCIVQKDEDAYDIAVREFLDWVLRKTAEMKRRDFPNSVEEVQDYLREFKAYLTNEKPEKYRTKVDIEAKFFAINSKLRILKQPAYQPQVRLQDLESMWANLEKEENSRQAALILALIELEKLSFQATLFFRKASLRKSYIDEMSNVLSDPRYGINLNQVQASLKKHEAIAADIASRKERLNSLKEISHYLWEHNYSKKEAVKETCDVIGKDWDRLEELVNVQRQRLNSFSSVADLLRSIEITNESVLKIQSTFVQQMKREEHGSSSSSTGGGGPRGGVESSIQSLSIFESELKILSEKTTQKLKKRMEEVLERNGGGKQNHFEVGLRYQELVDNLQSAKKLYSSMKAKLEAKYLVQKLIVDQEEIHLWIYEKLRVLDAVAQINVTQGGTIQRLLEKLSIQRNEMTKWRSKIDDSVISILENLKENNDVETDMLTAKLSIMEKDWLKLEETTKKNQDQMAYLESASNLDLETIELESWMKTLNSVVSSDDYGTDLITCNAQIHRLSETEKAAESFQASLDVHAQKVNHVLSSDQAKEAMADGDAVRSSCSSSREKISEREVPQVQALYAYNGKDVQTRKGEIMFLIAKTNEDWWSIRRANGSVGFVPRNYIVEIAPKVILVRTAAAAAALNNKSSGGSSIVAVTLRSFNLNGRLNGLQEQCHDVLLKKLKERREKLRNYQNLFKFRDQCDSSLLKIKGHVEAIGKNKIIKENMSPSEHCCSLNHQYETEIGELSQKANELKLIFPSEKRALSAMIENITVKWKDLELLIQQTRDGQKETIEADKIQEDCQESLSWLHEKFGALEALISSRTKTNTEPLLRKFELFQRELAPLDEKVFSVSAKYEKWNHIPHLKGQVETLNREHGMLRNRFEEQQKKLVYDIDNENFKRQHGAIHAWVLMRKRQLDSEAKNEQQQQQQPNNNTERLGALIREIAEEHQNKYAEANELLEVSAESPSRKEATFELMKELETFGKDLQELELQIERRERNTRLKREHSALKKLLEGLKFSLSSHDDPLSEHDQQIEEAISEQNNLALKLTTTERRITNLKQWLLEDRQNEHEEYYYNNTAMIEELQLQLEETKLLFDTTVQTNADIKSFFDFKLSTQDALDFIGQKMKMAVPEELQSNGAILKKKLKHQGALETEIRVYASQIKMLNIIGSKMIRSSHSRSTEIASILDSLNNEWDSLVDKISSKSEALQQSQELILFLKALDNVRNELESLKVSLEYIAPTNKTDCVKKAKKVMHVDTVRLENVSNSIEALLRDHRNHVEPILRRYSALKEVEEAIDYSVKTTKVLQEQLPANLAKYAKLEEFFDLLLTLDLEKQWIEEKLQLLASLNQSENIGHVQSRGKKLSEEITSHTPTLQKLIQDAEAFVRSSKSLGMETISGSSSSIAITTTTTTTSTTTLEQAIQDVAEKLKVLNNDKSVIGKKLSVLQKRNNILSELQPIVDWCEQKKIGLRTDNFGGGNNEANVLEMLKKHRGIELELDCYTSIVLEVQSQADAFFSGSGDEQGGHEETSSFAAAAQKEVKKSVQGVCDEVAAVSTLSKERRCTLLAFLQYFEFLREVEDLSNWIDGRSATMNQIIAPISSDDSQAIETAVYKFNRAKISNETGVKSHELCGKLAQRLEILSKEVEILPIQMVQREKMNLDDRWAEFSTLVENIEVMLSSREEIHSHELSFAEILKIIKEKLQVLLSQDMRDNKSVLKKIRHHQIFKGELELLDQQISMMGETCKILSSRHRSEEVRKAIQLKDAAAHSLKELKQEAQVLESQLGKMSEYFAFNKSCEELTHWTHQVSLNFPEIGGGGGGGVCTIQQSQNLRNELENIKFEIEGKEAEFKSLLELAERVKADSDVDNFSDRVIIITQKLGDVMLGRQQLHMAWQERKVHVDQLVDYNFYLRDLRHINSFYTSIEMKFSSQRPLQDLVKDIQDEVKGHALLGKNLEIHFAKVKRLKVQAKKLTQQNHIEAKSIRSSLEKLDNQIRTINAAYAARGEELELFQAKRSFYSDAEDRIEWIAGKIRFFNESLTGSQKKTFAERADILKRFNTFENDVQHNTQAVQDILCAGALLETADKDVHDKKEELNHLWEQFQLIAFGLSKRIRLLAENQCILREIEDIESIVRDSTYMCQAGDTGKDYEHCRQLERKFNNLLSEQDRAVASLSQLKRRIEENDIGDLDESIVIRLSQLQDQIAETNIAIDKYRQKLQTASERHKLDRDIQDVQALIKDKRMMILNLKDIPPDSDEDHSILSKKIQETVQILTDKEKLVETSFSCSKVFDRSNSEEEEDTDELSEKKKLADLTTEISLTRELADQYHKKLQFHQEGNQIRADVRTSISLLVRNREKVSALLPVEKENDSEASAEVCTEEEEIDRAIETVKETEETLKRVDLSKLNQAKESYPHRLALQHDITAALKHYSELSELCVRTKQKLVAEEKNHFQRRKFVDLVNWVKQCGSSLAPRSLGRSSVETNALIIKLSNVKKDFSQHENILHSIINNNEAAVAGGDCDDGTTSSTNNNKFKDYVEKMVVLKKSIETYSSDLHHASECHALLDEVAKTRSLIEEKWQIAIDESYVDLVNIPSKIRKHEALERKTQDIAMNIECLEKRKKVLLEKSRLLIDPINEAFTDLNREWTQLMEQITTKHERLRQSNTAANFCFRVNEVKKWLDQSTELVIQGAKSAAEAASTPAARLSSSSTVSSDKAGEVMDFKTTSRRLRALQQLISEIKDHEIDVRECEVEMKKAQKDGNFLAGQMDDSLKELKESFKEFKATAEKKLTFTSDTLVYQEFSREVDLIELWMQEKTKQVELRVDLDDLLAVQSDIKRQKIIRIEVINQKRSFEAVIETARRLVEEDRNSYASKITIRSSEIGEKYEDLVALTESRSKLLEHALLLGHYRLHCKELQSWMIEKSLFLDQNASADDNIFQECFDKVKAFESEMTKQEEQMVELKHQKESLIADKNSRAGIEFHSERRKEAEDSFEKLQGMFANLKEKLKKSLSFMSFRGKYIDFNEEFEDLHSILTQQLTIASSEDYGKDLDGVQKLIDNFQFTKEENEKLTQRIDFFALESKQQLFELEIYGERISEQIREIKSLCNDVLELSNARMDALMGAKTVHSFDKTVDDLVELMSEKIGQVDQVQFQVEEEEIETATQRLTVLQSGCDGVQEEVNIKETIITSQFRRARPEGS